MAVRIGWWANPLGADESLALPPRPLDLAINSPFVRDWVGRTWVLYAPLDLSCELSLRDGRPDFRFLDDSIDRRPEDVFQFTPVGQYAAPDRPSIQWLTSNLCVADETVWIETCAPFLHRSSEAWPGVLIPGRMDIHKWTRPFQWVFEWRDLTRPLMIRRGDPLMYIRFHTPAMDDEFEMFELERSWELDQAIQRCGRIAQYKTNALSHQDEAATRRPDRWLTGSERRL